MCAEPYTVTAFRASEARYCSRKCYYKAMSKKGSVKNTCKHCGAVFLSAPSERRVYCSRACNSKESRKTWKATFATVREAMKRRGMLNSCERCGYSTEPRILGVHHKDQNRKNNKLSNLEVLCPNCHSLEHLKHTPHGG